MYSKVTTATKLLKKKSYAIQARKTKTYNRYYFKAMTHN